MPTAIGNVSFAYDGNGMRVKKTSPGFSTHYIDKLYECTNGVCTKYIFAGDQRVALVSGTVVLYYHPDHQGSASVITNADGNVEENIAYYPFGGTRSDDGTVINLKHKYTDQEFDSETELYNYNARLYDPDLGRFLTPDSIVPDLTNPQSLNRYSYVQNNPVNLTDPTGHSFWGQLWDVVVNFFTGKSDEYDPPAFSSNSGGFDNYNNGGCKANGTCVGPPPPSPVSTPASNGGGTTSPSTNSSAAPSGTNTGISTLTFGETIKGQADY